MRKRDLDPRPAGDAGDLESVQELYDQTDAPNRERMRRERDELSPRGRGRLTEQARARLAERRELDAAPAVRSVWLQAEKLRREELAREPRPEPGPPMYPAAPPNASSGRTPAAARCRACTSG